MTEQELLALQQQVNVNTQAIEEIKEVLAQMNEASEAAATNETLIQALQEQVAQLTISVQTVANNTSTHESRITALEEKSSGGVQASLDGTTLRLTIPKEE